MAEPAPLPTEPSTKPTIISYVLVHPGMTESRSGFTECLSGNFSVDALVVGTYDSGFVPGALIPGIDAVTQRGIPVFGVRQTLFVPSYPVSVDYGRTTFDKEFTMQPEALHAGLVPLQVYPSELLAFADGAKRLLGMYGALIAKRYVRPAGLIVNETGFPVVNPLSGAEMGDHTPVFSTKQYGGVEVIINGQKLMEYFFAGLQEVCSANTDYASRVAGARVRFNSSRFNERIDEALRNIHATPS